jgi:hypothetical protein
MGEARRRKYLDPNWGKTSRQVDSENQDDDEIVSRVLSNSRTILLNSVTIALMQGVLAPINPHQFAIDALGRKLL